MRLDARYDLLYVAADLNLAAEQLLGLRNLLALDDLADTELELREVIVSDLGFGGNVMFLPFYCCRRTVCRRLCLFLRRVL